MAEELCRGSYNVQCFSNNDAGVKYSVLVSASGSHRTTGYRAFLERDDAATGGHTFALHHERTKDPDLQMMTEFQVTLAFESLTQVTQVKIRDAKGKQLVGVQNLPTLTSTCPA